MIFKGEEINTVKRRVSDKINKIRSLLDKEKISKDKSKGELKQELTKKIAAVLLSGTAALSITGCNSEVEQNQESRNITTTTTVTTEMPNTTTTTTVETEPEKTESTITSTEPISFRRTVRYVDAYDIPDANSEPGKQLEVYSNVTIKQTMTDEYGNKWYEVALDDGNTTAWLPSGQVAVQEAVELLVGNRKRVTIGGNLKPGQSIQYKTITEDGTKIKTLAYGSSFDVTSCDYIIGDGMLVTSSVLDYDKVSVSFIDADYIEKIEEPTYKSRGEKYVDVTDEIINDYLSGYVVDNEVTLNKTKTINNEGFVNVRSGPSTDYSKVGKIKDGEEISLRGDFAAKHDENDYGTYWIQVGDGEWIRQDLLKPTEFKYKGKDAKVIRLGSEDFPPELIIYKDENGEERVLSEHINNNENITYKCVCDSSDNMESLDVDPIWQYSILREDKGVAKEYENVVIDDRTVDDER